MSGIAIRFPTYPCPYVTGVSVGDATAATSVHVQALKPGAVLQDIAAARHHPLFPKDPRLGPPRYFQNIRSEDAQWLPNALRPHYRRSLDLLSRLFPNERETLLGWVRTWPEEYRLAFFVAVPRIWENQVKALEVDSDPDDLFGPVVDPPSPDLQLRHVLADFEGIQEWFDSFYRPVGSGSRWRRRVGSGREVAEFNANFRPGLSLDVGFAFLGKSCLIQGAAIAKMLAWAEKFSEGWTLETTGTFFGEEREYDGRKYLALMDFLPRETVNGDASLARGPGFPTGVISADDPFTPPLVRTMQEFLSKSVRKIETPYPLQCYFHSHPRIPGGDRPSVEDLVVMRGESFEFLYAPHKKALMAWGEPMNRKLPRDYYGRPIHELEALGLFKTVGFLRS